VWLLILSSPAIPTNVNALRHGLAARGSTHPVSAAMHVLRLLQPIVIGRLGGHTLERSLCDRFPRRGHLAEWCWAWRTTSPRRALAS
jgi:hypothetical protein